MQERFAAIVVFGAPLETDGTPGPTLARRLVAALTAAQCWPAVPVIVSGGAVRTATPEAWVMKSELAARGVAAERLVVEDRARNTLDTVRLISPLLDTLGAHGPIVIVSSGFHAPRCWFLLRASGVRIASIVTPVDERRAMGFGRWAVACAREMAALPWCLLRLLGKRRTRE
ncbi:MAG: YdcF family protein [Alphaproteobacteria bacterium]|nr:YdcF family protein [Alphaproteobacteria bacterium]